MRIRRLLSVAAVVLTGCAGSDTASDVGTTVTTDRPAETAAPVTEPAGTAAPVSEPADGDGDESAPTDVAEADDGILVIDGPARVRPSCVSLTRGVTDLTLDAGGGVHDVRIFVPTEVSSDPAPVVLDWHGLRSTGPEQAALSGYEALAEEEGFIVVHPTGLAASAEGPTSWEFGDIDVPGRDDVAFADALIDTLVTDWCGDPDRIYSTGMSNGGFFTAELVCRRADRIAAAVSVAGITHPEGCDPARAVPYLAFHGTDDRIVPYVGTGESSVFDEVDPDGSFGQVMPDEFAEFVADAGCDAEPVRTEETPEVISHSFTGCADDVPMTFYEIVGGGHTWPGSTVGGQPSDYGFSTDDISATVDGWAFMSQYSL